MTDNMLIDRSAVEQALRALEYGGLLNLKQALAALRAALDQPQNHIPGVRNMVTAGWKLVPVEPTRDMLDFAEKCVPKTPRAQYIAMLSAAPRPQGDQEPDWSDSKTLPFELWKNPLLSLQERLQIADGAVQWNREVAENLRARASRSATAAAQARATHG